MPAYPVNRVKNPVLVLRHKQAERFHVALLAPLDQDIVVKGYFSFGVAAGAAAVGANCGQGIEGFATLCSRMKAATELPVWIKANAGLPELMD